MAKNIEINIKNNDTQYEQLYPKSLSGNIYLSNDSELTIVDYVDNHRTDDTFEVGDILCTTRKNISDKWLLCDGSSNNNPNFNGILDDADWGGNFSATTMTTQIMKQIISCGNDLFGISYSGTNRSLVFYKYDYNINNFSVIGTSIYSPPDSGDVVMSYNIQSVTKVDGCHIFCGYAVIQATNTDPKYGEFWVIKPNNTIKMGRTYNSAWGNFVAAGSRYIATNTGILAVDAVDEYGAYYKRYNYNASSDSFTYIRNTALRFNDVSRQWWTSSGSNGSFAVTAGGNGSANGWVYILDINANTVKEITQGRHTTINYIDNNYVYITNSSNRAISLINNSETSYTKKMANPLFNSVTSKWYGINSSGTSTTLYRGTTLVNLEESSNTTVTGNTYTYFYKVGNRYIVFGLNTSNALYINLPSFVLPNLQSVSLNGQKEKYYIKAEL